MTCTGSIYKQKDGPFLNSKNSLWDVVCPHMSQCIVWVSCRTGSNPVLGSRYRFFFPLEFLWNFRVGQSKNLEEMSHEMCGTESGGHREWHFARGNWGASRFLKVLSTLSEDQWLIPRIHTRQLNYSVTPAQGVLSPSFCAHKYLHIYTRRHINK